MAQLRQDYAEFTRRGAEVVVVGPDGPRAFQRFWEQEQVPFVGLADVGSRVASQYDQEVNLIKLGRMPAVYIVDRDGVVRYRHHGSSMSDIPASAELLEVLDALRVKME